MRPHRWQPTRLPCPWDSPGKSTGVGCHFLLQCMKVKSESEVAQSCPTLCDPMDGRLRNPWDFPGKNTGVGCHCLRQGIFPTLGSSPGLLHYRRILYHLCHQGSIDLYFMVPCEHVSEKAMAPHSSTLAWKTPWTEEPGRLQSMGSLRV